MTMTAAKFAAAAAALGLMSACDGGLVGEVSGGETVTPGEIVQRDFPTGDFTRIELGAPAEVEVQAGGTPSIRATGGKNFLDATEVVVEDGTLRIKTKAKNIRWSWNDDKGKLKFVVTGAGALAAANVGGSGSIRIDSTSARSFEGNVGGSGDLHVAGLAADSADFNIGGSGNVKAQGAATKTKFAIGGSGDIDAAGLKSTDTDISVAGSGNVAAQASGAAAVSVVGSGDVTVTGGAKCTTSKMGSGEVTCS